MLYPLDPDIRREMAKGPTIWPLSKSIKGQKTDFPSALPIHGGGALFRRQPASDWLVFIPPAARKIE